MSERKQSSLTRRESLLASLALPSVLISVACGEQGLSSSAPTAAPAVRAAAQSGVPATPQAVGGAEAAPSPLPQPQVLLPTPECKDGDDVTPPQTAGPFFKPDSPQRNSLLEAGIAGTRLIVTGFVFSTTCKPIARALLDFWQADANGSYDNVGFKLRGHQFTDAAGRFYLETIVPGEYPGRTRHIHVRVQAPDNPILTTQLYFPGEPRNQTDGIFRPELVMKVGEQSGVKVATFNFVLDVK